MFSTLDSDFILKLLLNTFSVCLLVFGCYMRGFSKTPVGNREHATSFILFAVGVFSVTYLLHSVDISMGFAFGLFAVFSMLRYRTESITVKEMTYLFLVIAMSLLSSVGSVALLELFVLHSVFISCALLCEHFLSGQALLEKTIQYEKIENIVPDRHDILIEDLKNRTGLNVQDVSIVHIDFVKDCVDIIVKYQPFSESYESLSNYSENDAKYVDVK
jgi:hypothetical protein